MNKTKVTFLLSLPRCGSYALSKIHNTKHCFAHHEGHDFDFLINKDKDYGDTYSGARLRRAIKEGINYFCCDQSMGLPLLTSFIKKYSSNSFFEINVISLTRDQDDIVESFERLNLRNMIRPIQLMANIINASSVIKDTLDELSNYENVNLYELLYRNSIKDGFFRRSVTTFVAGICGSIIDFQNDDEVIDLMETNRLTKWAKPTHAIEGQIDEVRSLFQKK